MAVSQHDDARFSARMPDHRHKKDGSDGQRINADEEYEVRYWTEKLGVSREQLRRAVQRVGPMVEDLKRALKK
jgi:hypothetical protein